MPMKKHTLVTLLLEQKTIDAMNGIDGYEYRFRKPEEVTADDLSWAEIIVGDPTMEQIRMAEHLEWIQTDSAGVDRYRSLDPQIVLSNAYGAYGPGIAEFMTACILMTDKKLNRYVKAQADHSWKNLGYGIGIENMKVLSVGMGSIGSEFLKRMHALGAKCYGVRRSVHEVPEFAEAVYQTSDLKQILPEMDAVALSLPETPDTIHLFDREMLSCTKHGSILMNVGRGTAIDQTALLSFTRQHWFSAVILDVTEPEPLPKNNPLWNEEDVIITPHISGRYHNPLNYDRVSAVILENLKHAAAGEPLKHVIDLKKGY